MFKKFLFIMLILTGLVAILYQDTLVHLGEDLSNYLVSRSRSHYYALDGAAHFQDITPKLIADKTIPTELKKFLVDGRRRVVIFKYRSGAEFVAGYFCYLTQGSHPLMVFLRGGTGYAGIMRPNNQFSFLTGYNVVGTLYRGNIYGGQDEFGGKEVDDVENLLKTLPQLQAFTKAEIKAPYTMMGVSRGAMEMFIALSRSAYVKANVNRAIAVSGNVDLRVSLKNRPDMKYKFNTQYKNSGLHSFEEWIASRNPVDLAPQLAQSLKVLLVYGLKDNRVYLEEQENLKNALNRLGISSTLIIVPGGNHGLENHFAELDTFIDQY